MTSAFRQKYGIGKDVDHSFETPAFTNQHEIQPNQSYEVAIDGESVIVQGSNLKPMKSKAGYYRLLYQDKIHVLHISEIREIDRTENDVVVDSDEETLPPPALSPTAGGTFNQTYSVKLNNTWMRLPQSNVSPSRERPGYYNVTHQGKVFNISAVNVIPLDERQLTQQQGNMYNPYQTNYNPAIRPPTQVSNVPRTSPAISNAQRSPGQPFPPYNPYQTNINGFPNQIPQPGAFRPGMAPVNPAFRPGMGPVNPALAPVNQAINRAPGIPNTVLPGSIPQQFRMNNPNVDSRSYTKIPPNPNTSPTESNVFLNAAQNSTLVSQPAHKVQAPTPSPVAAQVEVPPRRAIRRESYTIEKTEVCRSYFIL